jgi:predicted nucleic acid-binding protein
MIVVADASAVGSFLLEDEAGPFADFARSACIDNDVSVPSIWPTELASLISTAYRRGRIDEAQRDSAARQAEALLKGVTIVPDSDILTLVQRARATNLSTYDTSYLLLAERVGGMLLTSDGPLRRAALECGTSILIP